MTEQRPGPDPGSTARERGVTFVCGVCGEPAGTVRWVEKGETLEFYLREAPDRGVFVSGWPAAGWDALWRCSAEQVATVERLLTSGMAVPAADLAEIDPGIAPFFCQGCAEVYCADHWTTVAVYDDDSPHWYDSTYGTCPRGHRRLLDD